MIVSKSSICSGNTCLHNVCPQFPPLFPVAKPKKTASGTYRIQTNVKGVTEEQLQRVSEQLPRKSRGRLDMVGARIAEGR